MPVVGYLRRRPFVGAEYIVTAFLHGLSDNGFIEGKNVRVEYRSAEGLETTSLHLDVLRDLKRIHSHICSVAYPVPEAAGEIPASNVAESDPITITPVDARSPSR
jgi:hypothetical protein